MGYKLITLPNYRHLMILKLTDKIKLIQITMKYFTKKLMLNMKFHNSIHNNLISKPPTSNTEVSFGIITA